MREFKFRHYNKDNKEMHHFKLGDYPELYSDKDVVMQFTGLLDKQGKEIYEGDIVECEQLGQKQKGKVIFRKGMWSWEFEKGKDSWLYECVKQWKGEIIGNIYENPELLGNTK